MPIIDLSTTIENNDEISIVYRDHKQGSEKIKAWLNVAPHLLRYGEGWATEEFTKLPVHSSTHIDAPWHYNSMVDGKPAMTVDELPLEWFFSDGVVLEMRHKTDGDVVTIEDIESELNRVNYSLKPLDIVLVRNGQDRYYGQPDYRERGCGVSGEATRWLYQKGVRVMGIDAWGWDAPLQMLAEEANQKQEQGIFWQSHQADIQYCQIERLVNLDPLPSFGFKVACFPLKIKNGSGGPSRVVAILPDQG